MFAHSAQKSEILGASSEKILKIVVRSVDYACSARRVQD
jgi:hypothetical protein